MYYFSPCCDQVHDKQWKGGRVYFYTQFNGCGVHGEEGMVAGALCQKVERDVCWCSAYIRTCSLILGCIQVCCLCLFACLYMRNHADTHGVGFTGSCEPPDWLLRAKLEFFERASALNDWAVSAAPLSPFYLALNPSPMDGATHIQDESFLFGFWNHPQAPSGVWVYFLGLF